MFSANSSQVSEDRLYVEDVFSTYLYTGNGSTQTITNGIDLAGKGGLVWMKGRNNTTNRSHNLVDTVRGSNKSLFTNLTNGDATATDRITSFNSNGFGLGSSFVTNENTFNYVSWTFRKAPKFFDVVTYTGNGTNRTIAHNLGVVPGMILVKRTDVAADWQVYHRSNANTQYMVLNTTAAVATGTTRWNSTTPTATEFTVGTDTTVNVNGGTYVAYLFAHDTASDGIIQCGSFSSGSSLNTVTLGWEPQWLLMKRTDSDVDGDWVVVDNMRGLGTQGGINSLGAYTLKPNLADAEGGFQGECYITATGFRHSTGGSTGTYIYIAIRRGPMRTPTSGTSVFAPVAVTSSTGLVNTINFPLDLQFQKQRTVNNWWYIADRLRGISSTTTSESSKALASNDTSAEFTADITRAVNNTSFQCSAGGISGDLIYYNFRRAPSFFDEVCYTGTGSARTVNHNLGVAPELMIIKNRTIDGGIEWAVYSSSLGATKGIQLNTTSAAFTFNLYWNNTAPTASVFTVGTSGAVNTSSQNYVAYLFASCPGVSKVGSYTGNGSSQTINCGFAAGARFVMIKRTDSTGDWYVWDTARGIVAGNDPRLSLNSTAAEVTTDDSVDTDSSGFVVNQLSATNINVSSATYIYLAVA